MREREREREKRERICAYTLYMFVCIGVCEDEIHEGVRPTIFLCHDCNGISEHTTANSIANSHSKVI